MGWVEMCKGTSKKLNRELQEQEVDFLIWVYEKHKVEEMDLRSAECHY